MTGRAVLLSGSLGMGHDVMAHACAVSLQRRQWQSETMDSLRLMGGAAAGWGERTFRALLSVPGVYDAFHFEQLRPGGRLARLAEAASCRSAVPALAAELTRQPADLVISVFATGAAAASRVKAANPDVKTVVFCTDVNPHSIWVHTNTDLYLVTSQTAACFVRRFHPDAEVSTVPAPVRPQFHRALSQPQARDALDIPETVPCVLLMGGSWGMGPLVEIATALADAGVFTLAVAGRNARLEARLRNAASGRPRLVPFGFTDDVPTLMAAADAVLTTSGDTCSEARAVGRHILLLDVVPGHGRENLQHELERGHADVLPLAPRQLLAAVLAVLDRLSHEPAPARQPETAWDNAFDDALARLGFAVTATSG